MADEEGAFPNDEGDAAEASPRTSETVTPGEENLALLGNNKEAAKAKPAANSDDTEGQSSGRDNVTRAVVCLVKLMMVSVVVAAILVSLALDPHPFSPVEKTSACNETCLRCSHLLLSSVGNFTSFTSPHLPQTHSNQSGPALHRQQWTINATDGTISPLHYPEYVLGFGDAPLVLTRKNWDNQLLFEPYTAKNFTSYIDIDQYYSPRPILGDATEFSIVPVGVFEDGRGGVSIGLDDTRKLSILIGKKPYYLAAMNPDLPVSLFSSRTTRECQSVLSFEWAFHVDPCGTEGEGWLSPVQSQSFWVLGGGTRKLILVRRGSSKALRFYGMDKLLEGETIILERKPDMEEIYCESLANTDKAIMECGDGFDLSLMISYNDTDQTIASSPGPTEEMIVLYNMTDQKPHNNMVMEIAADEALDGARVYFVDT